ncbi:hypothetical protein [Halorussus sp. AFM4]|uniref:hypothetical protein n=1 Tax=Halorussus sp. AFM4 TaxID=3421651 RepID=UPI003EC04351
MTDTEGDGESTDGRVDRRSVLKGTAAAGLAGTALAGTAGADGDEKEIRFCAAGDDTFDYFVRVSGSLERGGKYESDEYDAVGDVFAEGATSQERCDSFMFTGEIEELKLSGPGKVYVDGDLLKDTTKDDSDDQKLSNTVTIEAEGEKVEYKFRVSGEVEKGPEAGTLGVDTIDGNVVRGTVGGTVDGNEDPVDDYRYSGAIAFAEADGPLTVTLDINPD